VSFVELSSELVGRLPGLSPFLADTFINRAWSEIRRARTWSFLKEICAIVCPTQVVAGTVAITQFSDQVTADATASAALLAIALPAPLDLTAMQIRFGGQGNTSFVGQVYSIAAVDTTVPAAIVFTLDRVVVQATNPTSGYQCYRAYVKPTVDDFLRWESMVDMTNGWRLRLNYTSTVFDARDPQRQAQGMSYYVGAFLGNPGLQPRPQYELWPHPTAGQTFLGRFYRTGTDFLDPTEELPPMIPSELVIERALGYHAYRWAAENVSRIPQLSKVNYAQLMLESHVNYAKLLLDAKRNDNEQELNDVWYRGHGLVHGVSAFKGMINFPIDSNFLQSHLLNF